MATTKAKTREDARSTRAKGRRASAAPLRRTVLRRSRYEAGKCHVCGRPQMRNKVLCAEHEAMWRRGEIRLSRHGVERQRQRGNEGVVFFLYGERQQRPRERRTRRG